MNLAGCFNGIKTSHISQDQGQFDFSYDPFKERPLVKHAHAQKCHTVKDQIRLLLNPSQTDAKAKVQT